jgi:ADP-ribose pyrophosphatase YjhB (NUDIX family)
MLTEIIGKIWRLLPSKARTGIARATQDKFTVSAAGIITNNTGQVLLLNHVLRPVSGWGLPGGFIGFREQPEAGLRREIREETGLDLRGISLYRVRTRLRHIEIIFLARGVGEAEVRSREIIELGWFGLDEMPSEMSLDQHSMIRKALSPDEMTN